MEKRINAGYEIINAMQLKNQFGTEMEVVMGFNEKAASPYVTWAYYPNTNCYDHGHYFGTKEAVTRDFFERGMNEMALDLRAEYRKEATIEAIEGELNWNFNKEQVEGLLLNEDFMSRAIHKYDNIDHSAENEALRDAVEDIYGLMVENKEIFDFELVKKIQHQTVSVVLQNDEAHTGQVYFNPKNSLSWFFLEVAGASENEKPQWLEINLCDIKKIELDGKEIYPKDLSRMDLEELKNQIAGGLIRVEEYDEPMSGELQEQLLEYCLRNDEMRAVALIAVDSADLWDWEQEDLKYILNSEKPIAKLFEKYWELPSTTTRADFLNILKKSFLELYPLEKKEELDRKINEAGSRIVSSHTDKNTSDRPFDR